MQTSTRPAPPSSNQPAAAPARAVDSIVIHCSASPNGRHHHVRDIDAWHAARGMRRTPAFRQRQNSELGSIGYHFLIYINGAVATGRHLDEIGAHVRGHNSRSIGICMIGMDQFTAEQWVSLRTLVGGLREIYPRARVVGHRDLSPDTDKDGTVEKFEWIKTCPGFDVADWIKGGMAPWPDHLLPAPAPLPHPLPSSGEGARSEEKK